jgi:hypothetical protein
MVILEDLWRLGWPAAEPLAWAEVEGQPLLARLTPQTRAIVLMALLALVLVGIGLIMMAILGGRHVLREARRLPGPTPRYDDAWARKPISEADERDISDQAP